MNLSEIKEKMKHYVPEPPKKPREAAVLCLLRERDGVAEVLLEVRSRRLSHQPGEICFPGGGMEEGESPLECALRETEEELGLSRRDIHIICPLDPIVHSSGQRVHPFLGYVRESAPIRFQADEVEEVFTVPLDWFRDTPPTLDRYTMAPDLDHSPQQLMSFLPHYRRERPTVIWTWENKVIWGLTAKILLRLTELLRSPAVSTP